MNTYDMFFWEQLDQMVEDYQLSQMSQRESTWCQRPSTMEPRRIVFPDPSFDAESTELQQVLGRETETEEERCQSAPPQVFASPPPVPETFVSPPPPPASAISLPIVFATGRETPEWMMDVGVKYAMRGFDLTSPLSADLLQLIFCWVSDMCLVPLVCRQWHAASHPSAFLPNKAHFKALGRPETSTRRSNAVRYFSSFHLRSFPQLIAWANNVHFRGETIESTGSCGILSKSFKAENGWGNFLLRIVFAKDWRSIHADIELLEQLRWDRRLIVNVMYFFLGIDATNKGILGPRTAYMLQMALEMWEGDAVRQTSTIQRGHVLTDEQRKIINCSLKPGEVMIIKAFAGTGKTSTLLEYTRKRPHKKILYICFNKALQKEAQSKFPCNVVCRTIHQLAYAAIGHMYKHKLCFTDNFVPYHKDNHVYSKSLQILKQFIYSGQEHIVEKDMCSTQAQDWWLAMIDVKSDVSMPPDGFLKLWQLQKPKLSHFDIIMLDEAQDCNGAMINILEMQQSTARILVGDPHQQIYQFRHATDAMKIIKPKYEFSLTRSFRFGCEVGLVADSLLKHLKSETKTLFGSKQFDSVGSIANDSKKTIICRTNATIIAESINYITRSVDVGFVGGLKSLAVDRLMELYNIWSGLNDNDDDDEYDNNNRNYSRNGRGNYRAANHPKKKKRKVTWNSLKKRAEDDHNVEILWKIRLVEHYGHKLPGLLDRIQSHAKSEDVAQVLFTTIHKAKGLEWDNVEISGDSDLLSIRIKDLDEEYNLMYVAATRARVRLQISGSVGGFLSQFGSFPNNTFLSSFIPRITFDVPAAPPENCALCHQPFALSHVNLGSCCGPNYWYVCILCCFKVCPSMVSMKRCLHSNGSIVGDGSLEDLYAADEARVAAIRVEVDIARTRRDSAMESYLDTILDLIDENGWMLY